MNHISRGTVIAIFAFLIGTAFTAGLFLSIDTAFGQPTQPGRDARPDPHSKMLLELDALKADVQSLQISVDEMSDDVELVNEDVRGVHTRWDLHEADTRDVIQDVQDVKTDAGTIKTDVDTVKSDVEDLLASDREVTSVDACLEFEIGMEGSWETELAIEAKGEGGLGLKAGTGAEADGAVTLSTGPTGAYLGDATIETEICTDIRNLVEQILDPDASAEGGQASSVSANNEELAIMVFQFLTDSGLLSEDGELDTSRAQGLVDGIVNADLSSPDAFISLDSPLVQSISDNVPLPPALEDKLADPEGTVDALVAEALDKLEFCSPSGESELPAELNAFFEEHLGTGICDSVFSIEDVTDLFSAPEVTAAYNEMCTATNQFLATLRGTPVKSSGELIDFGQISLLKNAIPRPTTTKIGIIDVITGITLDKTFSNVGIGEKNLGGFNLKPFGELPTSVCEPVSS